MCLLFGTLLIKQAINTHYLGTCVHVVSREDSLSINMVLKASDTSRMVNNLAFVSFGSFSSIVGIVYLGLLMALLMV